MTPRRLAIVAAVLPCCDPAWAAPPFISDDPELLAPARWEVIPYLDAVATRGSDTGEAGIDATASVSPELDVGVIIPLHRFEGGRDRLGLGDVALSFKLALATHSAAGPGIALAPSVIVPAAATGRESVGVEVPVWIGTQAGAWSLYGGGGYRFAGKADDGDRAFGGMVARRQWSETFGAGGEVYAESGNSSLPMLVMAGLGLDWAIAPFATVSAAGHAIIANRQSHGRFHVYAAVSISR